MMLRSCSRSAMLAAIAVLLVFQIGGCAMIQRQETNSTEQLLSAGGFAIKAADTPEKLSKLQAMKQRKILRRQGPDGQPQFLFADATYCRCLYIGNEMAYQTYQRLSVEQQIAEDRQQAELDASMDSPWAYDWWSAPY
ncbi:MAG: hypothetical protein IPK78_12645 [Rhodospirillales bacterium]|nr:hypothetical protein [Rhodospirillales bacterium]